MSFSLYIKGFALSLSLIVAIGAQNTYVLQQGLKRQHVFWVCLFCAISDAILIALGVFGLGQFIVQHAQVLWLAQYLGVALLVYYAIKHLYQAYQAQYAWGGVADSQTSLLRSLVFCAALTWLNPHVYLDTVVLIGVVSAQIQSDKLYFALGAMSASCLFFFSLGYAAQAIAPVFRSIRAWRVLDCCIAFLLLYLAWGLFHLSIAI
ncbi:LysE/ArgO family amino acid transporter [Acinetobacter larvae]|uniref:Amino acid transporter n=1 Tax=Acinetobacter larvae TaxID=1789224 RepID=A0A1B2LXM1_9GAMM|nr:LysE family transporter [Acinetobacter larvae]AOA57675.1 amino acid transporter [Acinetobacter larvae]